jgi:hypothetical protein
MRGRLARSGYEDGTSLNKGYGWMYADENQGETWVGDKSTRNLELKREQWQSGNDGEEELQVGHKYFRGIKVG